MSRTIKGTPAPGSDWWGKRPGGLRVSVSQRDTKWWKRRQHKIERREFAAGGVVPRGASVVVGEDGVTCIMPHRREV